DALLTEPLPNPQPISPANPGGDDRPGPLVITQGDDRSRAGRGADDPGVIEPDDGLRPPPPPQDRGMLDEALADGSAPVRPAAENDGTNPADQNDPARAIRMYLDAADRLIARNDPLAARQALWDAMRVPGLDELELSVLRGRLGSMNEELIFGPTYIAGDPLSTLYTVKPGDALSRIARAQKVHTHWRLIQRVNRLSSPERIRVGQKLKLVRGPFHAIVDKSDYRLDLFRGETEKPETWVYIRSFEVGLGEGNSTPIGHFIVRPDSKLENPAWVNPRNPSEKYSSDDPANPIGEFWIGIEGLGDAAAYAGYGLHGTIEPDSIGESRSMGCVRLLPDDIALLYECLVEGESLVQIRE
ncbi:MAG TPA: LysM peptidoglycan-binding domain-containing protein, partial [Phycisphaerales bacterium]|nr:LysM peptidoglycan-binding domain-containing protein [Phycisphaerales bacterium]